jgi:cytochrome P450
VVRIAEGDQIAVWLSAADRDPDVFGAPDRFDITRSPTDI